MGIKVAEYKTNTIKPKLYNRVLDAWFEEYEAHNREYWRITRTDLIRRAGIHEQQFDTNFKSPEGLYKEAIKQFSREVDHWAKLYQKMDCDNRLWSYFFNAIKRRQKECRMALLRGDMIFWKVSLVGLEPYLKSHWVYCTKESYWVAYAMFVGMFAEFIGAWEKKNFADTYSTEVSWITAEMVKYLVTLTQGFRSQFLHLGLFE